MSFYSSPIAQIIKICGLKINTHTHTHLESSDKYDIMAVAAIEKGYQG